MLARSSNQLKMLPTPPSGPLQKNIKSTQKNTQNYSTQKLFNSMVVAQLRVTLSNIFARQDNTKIVSTPAALTLGNESNVLLSPSP